MSEQEIFEGCQQNLPQAQTALYHLYKARLMGICRRYAKNTSEAEDILQEAFIRIFRFIAQVQKSEALGGWLRRVVTHTAINYYHSQVKYWQMQDLDTVVSTNNDYWKLMANLSTEEILAFIQTLPDGYRMVFNLYIIDGYDHAEIATMLGISEVTSRSQLFKAREYLKKKLKEIGIVRYEQSA